MSDSPSLAGRAVAAVLLMIGFYALAIVMVIALLALPDRPTGIPAPWRTSSSSPAAAVAISCPQCGAPVGSPVGISVGGGPRRTGWPGAATALRP